MMQPELFELAQEAAKQTPTMLNGNNNVIQLRTESGTVLNWSWQFQYDFLERFAQLVIEKDRKVRVIA